MDIQVDPTLLVVNLDNINSDATRQIVKGGGCMYTVAVTTNDDTTMVQIPVSVHCAGDVQSAFGALPQLQEHSNAEGHRQYSHLESEQYTQIPGDLQCLVSTSNQVDSKESSSNNPENQPQAIPEQQTSLDINTLYYNDIFNYLTNNTMPEGATASHKLLLKKRAKSYCVKDGILFYGHSKPKKVITDREEQLKILQDVHIEKGSGVHLGVKKMYSAVNASCFWRGQYMDVANHVRQCSRCTEAGETRLSSLQEQYLEGNSSPNETAKGLLSEKTSGVWEKVEMAVYGPYSKTENENEFLVTLIDPVSQWIVAQPIPKENIPSHLISFVQHTFCLFGFAKCHVVKLSDDMKEMVQTLYKQQEASMQQFLSKFDLPSDTLLKDSIFVFSESDDECVWLNSLIKTFVNNHPTTWDSELMKFVFELNISKRGTAPTPFSKMFSRNPISFFSENKENAAVHFHNKENDVSVVSKRRRLQSSILQCRHCEEIFTSKISFRIHQRKHTEEARRRGILDGEEPIKIVSNRERRLLKRPMALKRKHRLLKQQGSADQEDSQGACFGQSGLKPASQVDVSDGRRAELRANTVAAVRRLLATTRDSRKRRGKYMKFPAEIQEEMARYAIDHGSLMTVRHFSSKLGVIVSESTIRNIVKWYQCYTPEVKEEIGRFAAAYGVDAAVTHFSERLGREVRHGLIRKFRKLYLLRYPEFKRQCIKNKASRSRIVKNCDYSSSVNKSKKSVYSAELKEEIGLYACNHSIPATVAYFSEKLNITLKQHVVRRCRKLCIDKQRATLQEEQQLISEQQEQQHHNNSLLPQQSHGPVPNHHESSGPSHSQTIDILQTSLNLLNNPQLNSSSAVLYNPYQTASLSHLQPSNPLLTVNHQQNPPLTFQSIDHCNSSSNIPTSIPLTYHQSHIPISASVIMNQNVAAVQTFQQAQVYSPFNHQNESIQAASVAVSNNASIPLAITQPSSHHTPISHHPEHSQPSSLSTVSLAVAPAHSDDSFQHQQSDPATVVVSQGIPQHPILVSHPQGTTALVQHFIASQSTMQASETPLSHHLLNSTHSTTENPQGFPQVLEHREVNNDSFSQTLNNDNNIDSVPFEPSDSVLVDDHRETYIAKSDASTEAARVKKELESVHVHYLSEPDDSDISVTVVTDQDPLELRNSRQGSKELSLPGAVQEVNTQQEHANIINMVSDCPMESNSHCKEIEVELSRTSNNNKKKSLPKRGGRKKGGGKGNSRRPIGQKRGSYTTYSPEIRAEMGKYAAEHGSQQACFYFRAKLGHEVAESTIRGLRDKYLKKRESFSAGNDSNCDKEVTSLGYAPRGRPMRLGKYDEVVQECIHELVRSGIKKARILCASNKIQRKSTKLHRHKESKPVTSHEDNMKGACNSTTLLESSSQAVQVPLLATSLSIPQYLDESVNSSESHHEVLMSIDTVSSDGSRDMPYDQLKTALPDLKILSKSNSNTDGDNFLSSSSLPVIFINDDNISENLFEDSPQFIGNNSAVSLEKCETDSIVIEQSKCTNILPTVLSSLDATPNHTSNYTSHSSNIGENDLGSMEEDSHGVAPSDKFKATSLCQTSNQAVMNQMLSNIDSKVIIEDQFNSCGTVFTNHDSQDDSSGVQLCTPGPDMQLNDDLETIELIYSTNSVEEITDVSSGFKPSEMEQDVSSGDAKARFKRDEIFTCDYCDRTFDFKSRLVSHIKRMHSGMLLSCPKCSYTTKCKELLKHHQAKHEGTFKCNECHKLFTREIYLKYHIASQHGETRLAYMCSLCNTKFKSETGVKRHIRTKHEPPEEYQCYLCDYVGNCMNSLHCHFERLHKKQFKCNDCDYQSTTESGLKKHVEIVHNIEERRFPCKLCSYRGAKRRQLLEHERNMHNPSINLHKCPICQKTFKTAVMLKHHLLCHTTRPLYSCKSCTYISRHRQTLHYHIKRMHPGHDVKDLSVGPSEADFQAIINSATQKLIPLEQTLEEEDDYASVTSQMIQPSELMLSSDYLPETFELQPMGSDVVDINSKEPISGACGSITDSSGLESGQMVSILDDPSLDHDKSYKIVSLSNVVSLGKHEMDHLVSFSKEESESINNITFIDSESSQIGSYVEEFQSVQNYSPQHTEALLGSVVVSNEKESSQPLLNTFIGSESGEQSERNDEMLPLVNTSVIFQDDITGTQDPVLHHEPPLLDFTSQQPLYEEEVSSWDQVTVYQLNS